jgi:8-oxo-dGTP pyrophosphatase MutT (NUDIX family)
MTPIIFTKKFDEELLWFNMLSGGFVGVILINFVQGITEIMFQKELDKGLFRCLGGGIDDGDGSLIGLKSQQDFLRVVKKTAIREAEEEAGISIDPSRLKLVGFSQADDEKDPKGGKVYMRTFLSYELLPGEKIPNGIRETQEEGHLEQYEYRWVPVQNGRADLEGKCVKVSKLHFAALITFLRGSR